MAVAAAADANDTADGFTEFRVAAGGVLAGMRSGFVGSVGRLPLELSFGIEQALFVNDALLVTTVTLTGVNCRYHSVATVEGGHPAAPTVASTVQPAASTAAAQVAIARLQQVTITTMQTQNGLVNVVQIGPGNTFSLNMGQLPSGVANVIPDTLDNQTIRQATSIQVSANSLSLLRASTFSAAVQRQLFGAIR